MRYAVMSDMRHHEASKPTLDPTRAVPNPIGMPGPALVALGIFSTLKKARKRYAEALADDINDRLQLLDMATGQVIDQTEDPVSPL